MKLAGRIHWLREFMLMGSIQIILEEDVEENSEDFILILKGKFYPIEQLYLLDLKCHN